MKSKLQALALTLAVLALGIVLGLWIACHRPLPHPGFAERLWGFKGGGHPKIHLSPEQLAQFQERLKALQPQLDDFQHHFAEIEGHFDTQFEGLLTEEQRSLRRGRHLETDWVASFNQMAESRLGPHFGAGPLPGMHEEERTLFTLMRIVMYVPTLNILTDRYHLTTVQQEQVRQLMEERRSAFLKLTDIAPLPIDQLYFLSRDLGLLPPEPPKEEHPDHPSGATPPHP